MPLAADAPDRGARREQRRRASRPTLPYWPVRVNCGSRLAMATPIWALAWCSCASRGAHVGALLDELRRQAHRQVGRQVQRGERQVIARGFVRKMADQRQQHVALLLELLLQRRQRRLRRRHLRFLGAARRRAWRRRHRIDCAPPSSWSLSALMMSRVASIWPRSEASCTAAVTTLDGQRQIGRLELEALILGERRVGFDLPPLAAEHIGRVGDIHRRLVEIED